MKKAMIKSCKPEECEKIFTGVQRIIVSKSKPNIQAPFKCYVYCTKSKEHFWHNGIEERKVLFKNPDTNQIKFDYSFELMGCKNEYSTDNFLSSKVIGEFVVDIIEKYAWLHENCTLETKKWYLYKRNLLSEIMDN